MINYAEYSKNMRISVIYRFLIDIDNLYNLYNKAI